MDANIEAALSSVRLEVLEALNIFLDHVKYMITLMTSIIAVALALVSFGVKQEIYGDLCVVMASVLLLLFFPISIISKKLVRRYYKIYVSNYFYSARLHNQLKEIQEHPWNSDLLRSGLSGDIYDENAVEKFIDQNSCQEKHSWYYYKLLITVVGYFCLVASVLVPFYWFCK